MPEKYDTPPIAEQSGSEGERKEVAEKIEVEEQFPRPWEKITTEEERRLIEKYALGVELSGEAQKFVNDLLKSEAEERRIEFAKKWFEEHKDELKAEGISLEISEERKIAIAIAKGAFEDLKTKEEYREKYEEIENLNVLRLEAEKGCLEIESQYLLLNVLEKRKEKINQEIKEMKDQGKSAAEISIKEKELDRLFKTRAELAKKVSGRDLEGEAKKEAETEIEPKEIYINNPIRLKNVEAEVKYEQKQRYFEEEWQKLSDEEKAKYGRDPLRFADDRIRRICEKLKDRGIEINEDDYLAFRARGYNPEKFALKGILRRKIEVKKGEIISKRKFSEFLKEQKEEFSKALENEARKRSEMEWQREYQELVRKKMEEKIAELAKSPERAEEGIEGMYRRVKDRLIAEWAERDLKKEPKTDKQLTEIKRKFREKGIKSREFIGDVLARRGSLGELTGNLEDDTGNLMEFFEKYGFKISKEDLEKQIGPERYKKEVRKERGFLELLLEILFRFLSPISKEVKK